jgi:hypothetical protein
MAGEKERELLLGLEIEKEGFFSFVKWSGIC